MLLDVDVAVRKLRDIAQPIRRSEEASLEDAAGRVLAVDVVAPVDLPPFDSCAMDGYAVDAAGLERAGAKRFAVIDRSAAGHPAHRAVGAGTAVRVLTGAVLPAGANAIVLQEDVDAADGVAKTAAPIRAGQHVRPRGHDVRKGQTIARAGEKLTAYLLAGVAACGVATVRVAGRVRVAVLSTGDELTDAGEELAPGAIYDSNRFALKSLLREKRAKTLDLGRVADEPRAIRRALDEASRQADLIIASGGVSVGEADFVKDAAARLGRLEFWKVALKPGKPLAVGRIGEALFFGLPGNPVSAIVTYLLFVSPALDILAGMRPAPPLGLPAKLETPIRHAKGRREYVRGTARREQGELVVAVVGDQGSHRLSTFANANCLVEAGEERADLAPGDAVRVFLLPEEAAHLMRAPLARDTLS